MFETLVFIAILSLLVVVHELGHFLAAMWAKIQVEEFGLGYPPRALGLFKYKQTLFSLNWIPFGGFVRMTGEEGPDDGSEQNEKSEHVELAPGLAPFYKRSVLQRLIVILGGVTFNFIFGVLIFASIYLNLGIPQQLTQARIGAIAPNSPAEQAKLPTQVNVIAIRDGATTMPVTSSEEAIKVINGLKGKTITLVTTGPCQQLTCQESAQEFAVYVRSDAEIPAGQGAIGIAFESTVFVFYPWYEMPFRGMWVGLQQAIFMGQMILEALGQVFRQAAQQGSLPTELAGPVGIVHQASQQGLFSQGWLMILNFVGMLSINLAIMNLLPIPALDGGRALFIGLEVLFGQKRTANWEKYANYIGFVLLIGLMLVFTARDVWRLFV
jgi:regulator of sigma E protease